jgi:hypothetical protein
MRSCTRKGVKAVMNRDIMAAVSIKRTSSSEPAWAQDYTPCHSAG